MTKKETITTEYLFSYPELLDAVMVYLQQKGIRDVNKGDIQILLTKNPAQNPAADGFRVTITKSNEQGI